MKPKLIRNWKELAQVPASNTHYLDIDTGYSGWIRNKNKNLSDLIYLSTHTFYESQHKWSTKILQERGFNIKLVSDEKTTKQNKDGKHLPSDIESLTRKDLVEIYHIHIEEYQKIYKALDALYNEFAIKQGYTSELLDKALDALQRVK